MKIIDLGICIDNNDPLGLGRVRCVRYSDYVSEKERALNYEPFSNTDIFVAIPFLPINLNFIPEIGQAVKIINYNSEKENINQEYIAGPFTTSHNFNDQSFSTQITNTSYGVNIKEKPSIFDEKGNYRKKRTEGAIAKKTDYGLYGKYGSDIIFTDNGLQLRGGKLLSKEKSTPQDRDNLYTYPIMSKKNSTLTLKKFPYKMELKNNENEIETSEVKKLNYIIEYTLSDDNNEITLTNPTKLNFYVYKVLKPYGDITKTDNFNENSVIPDELLKLININNDNSTPTHTISLSNNNVSNITSEIRDFIYTLHENSLKKINSLYENIDIHPFYFRPVIDFVSSSGTTDEITFKKNILSSIYVYSIGPKCGLIFSSNSVIPPKRKEKTKNKIIYVDKKSDEQTFASLRSDKIYILSTDPNKSEKNINFENLDKYELTQNDYIEKIDPNTYSMVRGENLLRFLDKLVKVLFEHEHNVVGPFVKTEEFKNYTELLKLMETVKDDILNNSIRIN